MPEFKTDYSSYFKDDAFTSYYDEIDICDFEFNRSTGTFTYPCPCGDQFEINIEEMKSGENIARCFSCSLILVCVFQEKEIERFEREMARI